MQRITYYKGTMLTRCEVCPHCFGSGQGRRKLNRFCAQCGESIHRLCLKSTAPAHEGFASHCETLRRQGMNPADVFVQFSEWPEGRRQDESH